MSSDDYATENIHLHAKRITCSSDSTEQQRARAALEALVNGRLLTDIPEGDLFHLCGWLEGVGESIQAMHDAAERQMIAALFEVEG